MKIFPCTRLQFFILYLLYTYFTLSSAQLPRQIKPKPRGFPAKRQHGGSSIDGRGAIEPMYRLNNSFIPSKYELELRIILDEDVSVGPQFTAPGRVKIIGVHQSNTSNIVLHAKELTINQSSVTVRSTLNPGQQMEISGFGQDTSRDFFTIQLGNRINPGEELEIYIEFIAKMRTQDVGLFYKTYENEDGEIRRLAATQGQPCDARRIFPCFDEPSLKATFQVTVIRKDNYTSLSNTELISSRQDQVYPGWISDRFAPTVKMSTYLLAIVVSDYDYAEGFLGEKPIRTYAPAYMVEAGGANYSVKVAAKCLGFYEAYFNDTYKLEKMDSLPVPEFNGAMENYGLNIYGTSFLIFLPDVQSESDRNLITLVIAHELAHQWFGNLVTLNWWSQTYLNEGLATYAQYLGQEDATPEFRGTEYAILDAVQFSMLFDARAETHPLNYNVSTPDEIDGMFSTISYEKGASMFRMMEGFLTRVTLQRALQIYLKKMAFQAVEQEVLFTALNDVALADNRLPDELNVSTIMHTWTDQSGYPLVKVDVLNETHLTFSQQRFRNYGSEELEGLWYIPVSIVTKETVPLEHNVPVIWLENKEGPTIYPHNATDWIMINNNATGYYRTLYDKPLAELIKKQLETEVSSISPLSRSQLLDDYFVLAKQKYINIQAALNFTTYLGRETHFTAWSTFFEHFSDIHDKFSSHSGYPVLQGYLQPKVDSALVKVGLEETSKHNGTAAVLRADLLDWSCSLQSPLCKEYALKVFAQWQAEPNNSIPITSVDAKATVHCAIVAAGGKEAFEFIFSKYTEADVTDREEYLNALACATDPEILEELILKTLNPESGLVPSDAIIALSKISANPFARAIMVKFISGYTDSIIEVIGNGNARPIGVVLGTLSKYFTTQSQLDEVQTYVDTNKDKLSSIALKSVLGVIRENISWMNTTGFDIWTWLWFQAR